jgi:hypothetical protein
MIRGVFVHLPGINVIGRFRTAAKLVELLGVDLDVQLIWVDPEPEYGPDEPGDLP